MHKDVESILYSEEQIKARVAELGKELSRDYAGKKPLLVGTLKGSFVFLADLVRAMDIDCEVDFIAASSYGNGTETTGTVKIKKDLATDIAGRDVIIVEDIIDSGVTLYHLTNLLRERGPASLKIVSLLNKPSGRRAQIDADYFGFEVPPAFIVGYGLDYAELYRNLPYIGILKPSVYEKA